MVIQERKPDKEVTVWRPFRELEDMERRFDDYMGWPFWRTMWRRSPFAEMWAPPMEVIEQDDKFLIKLELPGVKESDVDISVSGDTLTISGEKKSDSEIKRKGYHYSESSYGSFSRSITLPSTINANKIEANFDKGILEISMPKSPEVKPKKIAIAAKKREEKKELK
jgi:HSP20 family protein